MTVKRITLFWIVFSYFFIHWMNGQHYSLCIVLIKTNRRVYERRNDNSSHRWWLIITVPQVYLMAYGSGCLGRRQGAGWAPWSCCFLSFKFVIIIDETIYLEVNSSGKHYFSLKYNENAFNQLTNKILMPWFTTLNKSKPNFLCGNRYLQ